MALLVPLFTSGAARGDSSSTIVVLKAGVKDAERWEEGTQAVVAELLTTGFGLQVRAARAQLTRDLPAELQAQLSSPEVTGAVTVFREGPRGVAWVYDQRVGLAQVEVEVDGGPLSRSRFVLRIVELLRTVDIDARAAPPRPEPAPPPRAAPARPPSPRRGPLRFWLGAGATFASGLEGPLPWFSGSGALGIHPLLGIELSIALAPLSATARAEAGSVELKAQQLSAFVTFDPFALERYGVTLGLGGGALSAEATSSAKPGYRSREASAQVGVLSARARAFATFGAVQGSLTLDPGLLLPALDVTESSERALRIGRPWISVSAGVGVVL